VKNHAGAQKKRGNSKEYMITAQKECTNGGEEWGRSSGGNRVNERPFWKGDVSKGSGPKGMKESRGKETCRNRNEKKIRRGNKGKGTSRTKTATNGNKGTKGMMKDGTGFTKEAYGKKGREVMPTRGRAKKEKANRNPEKARTQPKKKASKGQTFDFQVKATWERVGDKDREVENHER